VLARLSVAIRIRPLTTSPALKPATNRSVESDRRLNMDTLAPLPGLHHGLLSHIDVTHAAVRRLRDRDREDAVLEIGRHVLDLDRFRQREGAREAAVATLDAMKLLTRDVTAGHRRSRPSHDDAVFLDVNLDLVTRQTRKLGGQDELGRGLEQVHRWGPAWCVGAYELTDLLMKRKQIA
jgi:hypothetical protein